MTDKQPTARLIIDPLTSTGAFDLPPVEPTFLYQPSPEKLTELIELKKTANRGRVHLRWLGGSLLVILLAVSLVSFSFVFGLLDETITLWLAATLALVLTTGLLAFHWWTRRS